MVSVFVPYSKAGDGKLVEPVHLIIFASLVWSVFAIAYICPMLLFYSIKLFSVFLDLVLTVVPGISHLSMPTTSNVLVFVILILFLWLRTYRAISGFREEIK